MPYCPKCRYEYEANISTCPDCDTELVAELKEPQEEDISEQYDNWVALASLTALQYSEMIIETLRAKDIPAILKNGTGYFGVLGMMGTSSYLPLEGSFIILVPEEFVRQADVEAAVIMGDDWEKCKLVDIKEE